MKKAATISTRSSIRRTARLSDNRLRLAAVIAALSVAAIAIILHVEAPAVWAFLGLVVTAIFGQGRAQE